MTNNNAKIVGLYVSKGGVPKLPLQSARVTTLGLEGDKQRDRRFHGGPQRALCLYSAECIAKLRDEGHGIGPGTTGENVLIEGLPWDAVQPGCKYRLGDEVVIEITSYTTPCANVAASFTDGYFNRIHQKKYPGESRVYARVLYEGVLEVGDVVTSWSQSE